MSDLNEAINYKFKEINLLKTALTHKSYAVEKENDDYNEKLEYLGDAVLQVVISDHLIHQFPREGEGNLSHRRARLVREETLAELAVNLNLSKFMFMGKGEIANGGLKRPRLLASTLEAIFGAIYLDGGFESAKTVIMNVFRDVLEKNKTEVDFRQDFKTEAQEYVQRKYGLTPSYVTEAEVGPPHDRTFRVALLIGSGVVSRGEGKSKKSAEQSAAKKLLEERKENV